jgi:acyl-CoA thioester hydrolase
VASSDRNEKPQARPASIIPPANTPARFPLAHELDVLWSDLDALGQVNNTRYFAWLEEARLAYFRLVGFDLGQDALVKPVLASTTLDFLRPVYWPDKVRVEGKTSRIGRTSLTMDYRIASLGQQAVVATGSAVVVLCTASSNRPSLLPEPYRDAIRKVDPDARETL